MFLVFSRIFKNLIENGNEKVSRTTRKKSKEVEKTQKVKIKNAKIFLKKDGKNRKETEKVEEGKKT